MTTVSYQDVARFVEVWEDLRIDLSRLTSDAPDERWERAGTAFDLTDITLAKALKAYNPTHATACVGGWIYMAETYSSTTSDGVEQEHDYVLRYRRTTEALPPAYPQGEGLLPQRPARAEQVQLGQVPSGVGQRAPSASTEAQAGTGGAA